LAVEPNEAGIDLESIPDVKDLVSVCAGLIVFDPESATIRFAHYTTQEYLERIGYAKDLQTQLQIASICFTYLSSTAFRKGSCSTDEEFEAMLAENPFLNYAATYWHDHARAVEVEVSDLGLHVLEDDDLVSVIVQVTTVSGQADKDTGYSQRYPTETKGLHLTAKFGLLHLSQRLLAESRVQNSIKDNPKNQYGRTPLSYAAEQGHGSVLRLLVEQGITEVDGKDQDGRTPLSGAAANGHEAVVKLLLDSSEKVEIDSRDQDGRTPLSRAAANGHEAVVKLLLDSSEKVEIDSRDQDGRTPLSRAAANGREAVVKLLLDSSEKVEIDSRDQDGRTPLSRAAANGREAVVKLLLDSSEKVEIDSRDQDGRTPLLWAAMNGHASVLKLLLSTGKAKLGSQEALLSWAFDHDHWGVIELLLRQNEIPPGSKYATRLLPASVRTGHTKVVDLLLQQASIDADLRDANSRTVLSHVAERGQLAICRLLLRRKDVLAGSQDCNGRTPLSWAAESGQEEIVQELLSRSDAKVDCKDSCGRTALHYAAKNGHTGTACILIEQADVGMMDLDNNTALLTALEINHLDVVRLLIKKDNVALHTLTRRGRWDQIKVLLDEGCHIDTRDFRNSTALHEAVRSKSTSVLTQLISSGADVNLCDMDGMSPLHLAVELHDRKAIEQFLCSSAALAGIKAKKWRDAYNNEADILVLSDSKKQGYSLNFQDQFDWPTTQPGFLGKRLL
jgi:ankyrin repeat protein